MVRHLKAKGRYEEARAQLDAWLHQDPDNPRLLLEMAETLDAMGRESLALGYYRRAIAEGLDRAFLLDAYLGLGANLRLMGRYFEARQVLERAAREFPDSQATRVLLALVLYGDGNAGDAIRGLLDVILTYADQPDLRRYRHAILYLKDHLHDIRRSDDDSAE